MYFLMSIWRRLVKDDSGGLSAEYSFLIVFIAIVAGLGMLIVGDGIGYYFEALTRIVPDTQENPPCPLGGC